MSAMERFLVFKKIAISLIKNLFYYFLAKLSFNENIYCQAFNLKAYGFVFI